MTARLVTMGFWREHQHFAFIYAVTRSNKNIFNRYTPHKKFYDKSNMKYSVGRDNAA